MLAEYATARHLRVGLIADTHMPGALEQLWPAVHTLFADVDLILHAGDLHVPEVIDELEALAPTFVCRGNGDEDVVHPRLRDQWCASLAGYTVAMTHKFPTPRHANEAKLDRKRHALFAERQPAVLVYGHTHFAEAQQVSDCLYVNPGSPTLPNNQTTRLGTLGFLDLAPDQVAVQLHQLTNTGSDLLTKVLLN